MVTDLVKVLELLQDVEVFTCVEIPALNSHSCAVWVR